MLEMMFPLEITRKEKNEKTIPPGKVTRQYPAG